MQVTPGKHANRLSGINFGKLGLWMLFGMLAVVLAIFFGLLAVTASPILVGMGAGLVIGAFLLMKPDVLIWLILLLGLATGAFVSMLSPEFSKITWAVSILGFMLLGLSLFSLFLPGRTRSQPAFIWIGLGIYGASILGWIWVLSKTDVSVAYPFVGIGFVLTAVMGAMFLHENVSPLRIAGTLLVIFGCVLIAKSA